MFKRTGNTTILGRGLPLAHQEIVWWGENRVIKRHITDSKRHAARRPFLRQQHGPRPEVSKDGQDPLLMCRAMWRTTRRRLGASPALNETDRGQLYSDLAAGAESGWDYSSRCASSP